MQFLMLSQIGRMQLQSLGCAEISSYHRGIELLAVNGFVHPAHLLFGDFATQGHEQGAQLGMLGPIGL